MARYSEIDCFEHSHAFATSSCVTSDRFMCVRSSAHSCASDASSGLSVGSAAGGSLGAVK